MERRVGPIPRTPPDDVRRDRLEVLARMGRAIPCPARDLVQDRLETPWLTPDALPLELYSLRAGGHEFAVMSANRAEIENDSIIWISDLRI